MQLNAESDALDLRAHRDAAANGQTPFTPAIGVVFQVDEGIRLMQAEGAASIFARHEACAAASRAGLQALGFELFADQRFASRTVTAAKLPENHDWKAFNRAIKAHGVVLAGGQGKLAGKIFRLGHLGSVTVEEILGAIATLETVSREQGRRLTPGSSVGAAYAAAVGISPDTLAAYSPTPLAGWFECALGLLVLFWPMRGVLLFVFAWKLGTEALRPLAGEPIWEFIERGGSYGAPLALAWIQDWRRTTERPPAPPRPVRL